MFKNLLTLAALGLSSLLVFAYAAEEAPTAEPPDPTAEQSPAGELPDPIAVVNGEPISQDVYKAYAEQRKARLGNVDTPAAREALTNELITQELLVQEAEKQNLTQDPQVVLQLEIARRNLLAIALVRRLIDEHQPSEETIQKEYEKVAEAMKTKEYKARHILVDTEEEAKEIIAELDKGGDFAELAKARSTDSSAERGGDLGWFTTDLMVQPFGEAVASQPVGEPSETPVQTQFGWHVIQVDEVRDASAPPLEQVRPQLEQALRGQVVDDYLAKLREQSEIEIK